MLCTLEKKPFRRFSRYKEAQRSTLKSIPPKKLWNLLQRGGREGKTHRHPHYSRISSFFDNKTLLLLKSGRKRRSGLRFNYHLFFPDRYITILYAWSQFHSPRYIPVMLLLYHAFLTASALITTTYLQPDHHKIDRIMGNRCSDRNRGSIDALFTSTPPPLRFVPIKNPSTKR